MRRRRLLAAGLWALLAFLIWNVTFDLGVRQSATRYLVARALYLRGAGPRVEMPSQMRAGIAASAKAATLIALPVAALAVWLAVSARAAERYRREPIGT